MMLMLVVGVVPLRAQDRLVEGAMILAPPQESDGMGKFVARTLEACFERIPERADPEQRLRAQQQCLEEETTRQFQSLVQKEGN